MERSERIATSVTPEMKTQFRVEAAKRDMDMSELLRLIIQEWLAEEAGEGNVNRTMATAD